MKTCSKCSRELSIDHFSVRSGRPAGQYQSWCKACQKGYKDKHYLSNKAAYVKDSRLRRKETEAKIRAIKEGSPCLDCGVKYPYYVMDFDHRDPLTKKIGVSRAMANVGIKQIMQEIEKCDIVCANCHRERTHSRGPFV